MLVPINHIFKNKITISRPGEETTMADLAQYVEIDPEDARKLDSPMHEIAYNALYREYINVDFASGISYATKTFISFRDGSTLTINSL